MPLKIVRNDIRRMRTEAIVNTANEYPMAGPGLDESIYEAAGYEELLQYRREKVGYVEQGEVFLTPAFGLSSKYIIHVVSPLYSGRKDIEEKRLRGCYRKALTLALSQDIKSISFPLIATGNYGYPKEEGFRIAWEEIKHFLKRNDMTIYLVVYDDKAVEIGANYAQSLRKYVKKNYVQEKPPVLSMSKFSKKMGRSDDAAKKKMKLPPMQACKTEAYIDKECSEKECIGKAYEDEDYAVLVDESALSDRIHHLSDTFSQYLIYLIDSKGMKYPDVYKRALVDKKTFSKIKNNPNAHPKKITAMCLCMGAQLNLDQSRDLLARAGYALSPCEKTDVIFSYFIENEIYDMIELDIQLEEYGLPCLIS